MIIKGKDLMFYVKVGVNNVLLCHAKTCTINTTASTLPTTTLGSGNAETNDYSRKYSYTIKGDGVTVPNDEVSAFTLQNALITFLKIQWTFTDNANIQWYGYCLVTTVEITSDFDAISLFTNELLGDGEYTFSNSGTPTPPVGDSVRIVDQFGTLIATVPASGTYNVTRFDTIDLRFWDTGTDTEITPQITITQTV